MIRWIVAGFGIGLLLLWVVLLRKRGEQLSADICTVGLVLAILIVLGYQ